MQDVCFKGEGLCVIFLKERKCDYDSAGLWAYSLHSQDGEASPAEIEMLTGRLGWFCNGALDARLHGRSIQEVHFTALGPWSQDEVVTRYEFFHFGRL